MRRLMLTLIGLLWPIVGSAQTVGYPPIPDLCAGSPDTVTASQLIVLAGPVSKGCLGIHGSVTLTGDLTVDTILVYPDGELIVQNGASITFRDTPLDLVNDPEQFGIGLIGLGRIIMTGTPKTAYVRLATEPRAGHTTIDLATVPIGWASGDVAIVPDTRRLTSAVFTQPTPTQIERRTLQAVSGTLVSMPALTFDHLGTHRTDGSLELAPHVANLSRSIVIRSANPLGTRGHLLFNDRAVVDIRGVEFRDLGRTTIAPLDCTRRATGATQTATSCTPGTGDIVHIGTNQIGRYPVHFHHLSGPRDLPAGTPQFTFVGNTISRTPKWAIAIHNSHYGYVADNVMADTGGAALMTEDGSETGNVIERNLVIGSYGTGGRQGGGREATGFYFRGPSNIVRDNVATGILSDGAEAGYGYKYFLEALGSIRVPLFPGADMLSSTETAVVDSHSLPVREFTRNEVYGATDSGLTFWWLGSFAQEPRPTAQVSLFNGLIAWHLIDKGVFQYQSAKIVLADSVLRSMRTGFAGNDYSARDLVIQGADWTGLTVGWDVSSWGGGGTQTIRDSSIDAGIGILARTLWTSGSRADRLVHPRPVQIHNVQFTGTTAIEMRYAATPTRNLIQSDTVTVTQFQGTAGDDFTLSYTQQAPTFIVPQTISNADGTPSVLGAPVAGLTNTQTWAQYGIAIAGAVAPCTTTRTSVIGFACATSAPPPQPVDCVVSEWSAWSAWTPISATEEQRTRTRFVVTQPANGGAACPPLTETETRAITPPPPPPDPCVVDPLTLTINHNGWPSSSTGSQLRWSTNKPAMVTFNPLVSPWTATAMDSRGCSVTVVR